MKSCWTLQFVLRLKFLFGAAFAVVLCIDVNAQDINFDDLRRGVDRPLAQNAVIPGLGGHADRYMSQFSEVDRSRSEARAEARRQYAESNSSRGGGKIFSCKVKCTGSFWSEGNGLLVEVGAVDREKAAEVAERGSYEACKKQTNTRGSSLGNGLRLTPTVYSSDCTEK